MLELVPWWQHANPCLACPTYYPHAKKSLIIAFASTVHAVICALLQDLKLPIVLLLRPDAPALVLAKEEALHRLHRRRLERRHRAALELLEQLPRARPRRPPLELPEELPNQLPRAAVLRQCRPPLRLS